MNTLVLTLIENGYLPYLRYPHNLDQSLNDAAACKMELLGTNSKAKSKSAVNRHRSRKRETVAFCVSQKWCRILLRGISAVHIVLVVFLRFFLPKAGSVGHQGVRGWGLGEEEFSVRRNLLQRGISALVIVFLCTVSVYTCLCVSLQRDT